MSRNDAAPLSRRAAATSLGVAERDLPAGEWTKGLVRATREERPRWLRDARVAAEARRREVADLERFDMIGILEDLGFGPEPQVSHQDTILRRDQAEMQARSRWPHAVDRFDPIFDQVAAQWWPAQEGF